MSVRSKAVQVRRLWGRLRRFAVRAACWGCALACLAWFPAAAWACPNCKDALAENDPARTGLVQGYFWSILFMLSMPFLIFGGLSLYFYLLVRQARAQAALAPAPLPAARRSVSARELAQAASR